MAKNAIAHSPAKLILSGEHAVVHQVPALAIAINRYTKTSVCWNKGLGIDFKLEDLYYARNFTLKTLSKLKQQLQEKYKQFLNGSLSIRNVLRRPFELLQYSITNVLESLDLKLPGGLAIKVDSNIPVGCGMGSSAAAIMSSLFALTKFLKLDLDLPRVLSLGLEAENLQHGKSSGLDLQLTTFGGCMYYDNGKVSRYHLPQLPLTLVNTGRPYTTTGEAVAHANKFFNQDKKLLTEFAEVVTNMTIAIKNNDLKLLQEAICANHRLLQYIDVVPNKVANFIAELEQMGFAAKVCGAGAISGNSAGALLVVAQNNEIEQLAQIYGYGTEAIEVDLYGTRTLQC